MDGIVAPEASARAADRNPLARPFVEVLHEHRTLREQLENALRDRDAYRVLAHETIHALAELTERHRQQTARYHRLLNSQRAQRQGTPGLQPVDRAQGQVEDDVTGEDCAA